MDVYRYRSYFKVSGTCGACRYRPKILWEKNKKYIDIIKSSSAVAGEIRHIGESSSVSERNVLFTFLGHCVKCSCIHQKYERDWFSVSWVLKERRVTFSPVLFPSAKIVRKDVRRTYVGTCPSKTYVLLAQSSGSGAYTFPSTVVGMRPGKTIQQNNDQRMTLALSQCHLVSNFALKL